MGGGGAPKPMQNSTGSNKYGIIWNGK